ncbi:hypothetical protein P153DRAFT_383888 [Dothidotthia symphoricarpi CBS 119687]|uniref:Uncharacterized protein n=1 Tax=Dothidotthia symphoricarpi CBS 119687 TaxID=1392245 RepID=A0A6A6AIL4_9PLEO|nr:uncharacterized protein P153DRAFT_383888 [Dothidotthia symphoricarpi CBS 119687]KAF2131799.1 hypothetical protein P153DRAFT_383888 [Dothidotthia symphoricarpi CBS 119687]
MKLAFPAIWATLGVMFLTNARESPRNISLPNVPLISNLDFSQFLVQSGHVDLVRPERQNVGADSLPALGVDTAPNIDKLWQDAICRGERFLRLMSYSDYDAGQSMNPPANTAQSQWSLDDLEKWGYRIDSVPEASRDFEPGGYWGIGPHLRRALVSDKCNEEGGLWTASQIMHDKVHFPTPEQEWYQGPDGGWRRSTGARFTMMVNPQGGIIAQYRKGIAPAAKDRVPPVEDYQLPPLAKSSDMMWALWERDILPDSRRKVQFFISLCVTNEETTKIIYRALREVGQPLSGTPYKFEMTTDQGKAVLGSPNAVGFAHFLIQHKGQLGLKSIANAYVFYSQTWHECPCLLLQATVVATPSPRPTPTPAPDPNSQEPLAAKVIAQLVTRDGKRSVVKTHTLA